MGSLRFAVDVTGLVITSPVGFVVLRGTLL
jgi:hypothetical protein